MATEYNQLIKQISQVILDELDYFIQNLQPRRTPDGDVFAYPEGGFAEGSPALQEVRGAVNVVAQSMAHRQKEPFIAYVKAEIDGELQIIYICRGYTPFFSPKGNSSAFVSYKTDLGRVVEKDINAVFEIVIQDRTRKIRRHIKILEKNLFKPTWEAKRWDGKNNQFFLESGIYSIDSLLAFISNYSRIESREKALATTLEVEQLEASLRDALTKELVIKEGLAREIRSKIALRDQPTLDDAQGNIFRLPLSLQLIITGAPGTGKTTTLIKRIAQKANVDLLQESERNGLTELELPAYFGEEKWIMYTPTELLKMYLKETFALEGTPASDRRIRIWDDERTRISRDILGFSKVGDRGLFGRSASQILKARDNSDLIRLSGLFDEFYYSHILQRFKQSFETLQNNGSSPQLVYGFEVVSQELSEMQDSNSLQSSFYLVENLFELRETFNQLSNDLDVHLDEIVSAITQTREEIFQTIFEAIEAYSQEANAAREEESDEDESIEEQLGDEPPTPDKRVAAKRQLRKTIAWYSQRLANKQAVTKETLHSRIIELLTKDLPSEDILTPLGKRLVDRRVADVLTRGYNNLLHRIPTYYHRFRLSTLNTEQPHFQKEAEKAIKDKRLDDNEYDLLIYTMLRNAELILQRRKKWIKRDSGIPLLERIKSEYVTQVAVDESTDFSSLQLGAMYYIAHPLFRSVTLSGDLMQRLTPFGLSTWDECKFISPTFQIHSITTVYRQSPKLLSIASKLYEHFIGNTPTFISAFRESTSDPHPLKFKSNHNSEALAKWIADRTIEIYRINGELPSIAIFVPEEEHIEQVYEMLSPSLKENSIDVEPCFRGKILSTEGKVRIFSIRYVKGLEFEGVFFVNLDQVSPEMTALIDKYLYVGLTRAASFLAVTYATDFPERIRFIQNDFLFGDWKQFIK